MNEQQLPPRRPLTGTPTLAATREKKLTHASTLPSHTVLTFFRFPAEYTLAGYLMKEGQVNTDFRKRYFIFEGDDLSYYIKDDLRDKKGAISLKKVASIDQVKEQYKGRDFVFAIRMEGRTFYIQAQTDNEMKVWMGAIKRMKEFWMNVSPTFKIENAIETDDPSFDLNDDPLTSSQAQQNITSSSSTLTELSPLPSNIPRVSTFNIPPFPTQINGSSPLPKGFIGIRRDRSQKIFSLTDSSINQSNNTQTIHLSNCTAPPNNNDTSDTTKDTPNQSNSDQQITLSLNYKESSMSLVHTIITTAPDSTITGFTVIPETIPTDNTPKIEKEPSDSSNSYRGEEFTDRQIDEIVQEMKKHVPLSNNCVLGTEIMDWLSVRTNWSKEKCNNFGNSLIINGFIKEISGGGGGGGGGGGRGIYHHDAPTTVKNRTSMQKAFSNEKVYKFAHLGKTHKDDFDEPLLINAKGLLFTTLSRTLQKIPHSYFVDMLKKGPGEDGIYFIDRNPQIFEDVLDYLRDGEIYIPDEKSHIILLKREAEFYNIPEIINMCNGALSNMK